MTGPKRIKAVGGWYHFASGDGFSGIEFLPNGLGDSIDWGDYQYRQNGFGPFATFGDAKRDALNYYKCDLNMAREHIADVREYKKPKVKK